MELALGALDLVDDCHYPLKLIPLLVLCIHNEIILLLDMAKSDGIYVEGVFTNQ
jgi:hypothetical protein